MSRRLPRSFFWVDQHLIRSGTWLKLSASARLAYIAVAASCDRQGVSIWSRSKLMELSACPDPGDWMPRIQELMGHGLIEILPENSPPAIRLIEFQVENPESVAPSTNRTGPPSRCLPPSPSPIVVHTHTTIHLGDAPHTGGDAAHVEPRSSD